MQLPFSVTNRMEFPYRDDNIDSLLCPTWWRDYKIRRRLTLSWHSAITVSFDLLSIIWFSAEPHHGGSGEAQDSSSLHAMYNSALKPPTGLGEVTTLQSSFSWEFLLSPLSPLPLLLPLPAFLFPVSPWACSRVSRFRKTQGSSFKVISINNIEQILPDFWKGKIINLYILYNFI